MFGEGNYALTAVQVIDTTEAFLNLDEEIKDCQNLLTYRECRANEYIKMGEEKCSCIPYELRVFSNGVNINMKLRYQIQSF